MKTSSINDFMLTISFYKEPELKRVYKTLDISRRKEIIEKLREVFRKEIEKSERERTGK